jgi:hypothetical protein
LRIGVSSYWMNSYWGGSVAAAGGALVLGALPRMMRAPRWRQALVMGSGLIILAHSRPVEGGFLAVLIALPLFAWMLGKHGPPLRTALRQVVLPLAVVLALAGCATAAYFSRVTGSPLEAPYLRYRNTMSFVPHFLWQTPTPQPLYNSRELRDFYVYWESAALRDAQEPWPDLRRKFSAYWRFYLGPILTLPLLAAPLLWKDRKARPLLAIAAAFPLVLAGQVWHNQHYAAPATGLAVLIVILSMRRLRLWRYPKGLQLARAVPWACAAALVIQIAAGRAEAWDSEQRGWRWPPAVGTARAGVLAGLKSTGERHLVFVRYGKRHISGDEWVYNSADIDGSPVVWGRELDRESNAALMRHFPERRVWLVEPDLADPKPVPYGQARARLMPFVQIGAPGIAVLRDPAEVRRRVLEKAEGEQYTCYQWSFIFEQVTGVAAPESTAKGCFTREPTEMAGFDRWFEWLRRQVR